MALSVAFAVRFDFDFDFNLDFLRVLKVVANSVSFGLGRWFGLFRRWSLDV